MRNNLRFLGYLRTGEPVYDRHSSHIHDGILGLLPEVLSEVSGNERFIVHEHDFGRLVGETSCVATREGDDVIWGQRPGRAGLTRFVKNRQAEPSSKAVVILKRDDWEPYYILITAFIGGKAGREPWDPRATDKDRRFWGGHALVYGSEPIIPGTETALCPA